jgi:hypothetical protein
MGRGKQTDNPGRSGTGGVGGEAVTEPQRHKVEKAQVEATAVLARQFNFYW